jgi:hypothetical protein
MMEKAHLHNNIETLVCENARRVLAVAQGLALVTREASEHRERGRLACGEKRVRERYI